MLLILRVSHPKIHTQSLVTRCFLKNRNSISVTTKEGVEFLADGLVLKLSLLSSCDLYVQRGSQGRRVWSYVNRAAMAPVGLRAPFSGPFPLSTPLQTRLPLCLLLVMFVHLPGGRFSRTAVSRFRVLTCADAHYPLEATVHASCQPVFWFFGRGDGSGLPKESSSRLKCALPSACRFSVSSPSAVFISLQNNHLPACFSYLNWHYLLIIFVSQVCSRPGQGTGIMCVY